MKKLYLLFTLTTMLTGAIFSHPQNVAYAEELVWSYEGTSVVNDKTIVVKSQSLSSTNPIYEGILDNILDNNSDTHAWFAGGFTTGDYIEVDLGVNTTIQSIKVDNGKRVSSGGGDNLSGYLQYENSQGNYVTIENTILNPGSNLFDFRNINEFETSKIRLYLDFGKDESENNVTSGAWGALSGIVINPLKCDISYSGSRVLQDGSLNSMVDGDIYTYARFNRDASDGVPTFQLTLDYYEPLDIAQIDVTNGSYNADETNYLEGTLQYSLDNIDWKNAGDILGQQDNIFNFRDAPIQARYLRIIDNGVIRWIALRDISITLADLGEPTIKYEGNRVLQNGALGNIIDGNDETYARFNRVDNPTFQIIVDYKEVKEVNSLRILNGAFQTDGNNFVKGNISYSSDGESFINIGILEGREIVLRFDEPIQARYIKVEDEGSYRWIALREIQINSTPVEQATISYEGFAFVEEDSSNMVSSGSDMIPYGVSLTDMIDDDLSTYTWFDWRCQQGAYILLDLHEAKEIQSISLYQGNEFHSGDMLNDASIYYSEDGINYHRVGEQSYVNQDEILVNLTQPVKARYVKVVSNVVNESGVVIREFSVDFAKLKAPIEFQNDINYTYDGKYKTPTYVIPNECSALVHYEQNDIFYSNEAPIAPGTYSLVVSVNENDTYRQTIEKVVFHIEDASLNALIELMNSLNTCSDYEKSAEARNMYNALSDDLLRETFDKTVCQEDEECTMINKLTYMESLVHKNEVVNNNAMNYSPMSNNYRTIISIVSLAIISSIIVVVLYKKTHKKYN